MRFFELVNSNNVFKLFLFLYIIIKPFYFYEIGKPQIADYVIGLAILFYFISNRSYSFLKLPEIKYLFSFLVLVTIINALYLIYFFNNGYLTFIVSTLYFGFNIAFFIMCVNVFSLFKEKDFNLILIVSFVSLLIQFVLYLFGFDKEVSNDFFGRRHLHFNNPNQLAYFCLLISTIILLLENKITKFKLLIPVLIAMATICVFFSSSRPAILGMLFLMIYFLFTISKSMLVSNILLLVLPMIFTLLIQSSSFEKELFRNYSRFERIENNPVKEYNGRGYERILDHPSYLIYGAGEGNFERFVTTQNIELQEIHNTIGSIMFNYGIVGLLFFALFIYNSFRDLSFKMIILFLPIFMYNMFHNGVRFSILWMLLAIVLTLKIKRQGGEILLDK